MPAYSFLSAVSTAFFSVPFTLLRNTMNIANNPVGLDATVAWYGFGFILYAVFDLVFSRHFI